MPDRRDFVLAALTPGVGADHSPVQVQKLFFLIDRNIPELIGGPLFSFHPYNYGPFDQAVYQELETLAHEGAVELVAHATWKNYRLTPAGQRCGDDVLAGLPPKAQDYISRANKYVRSLSFTQLVAAIYRAYPEMRANSVFQD